MRKYPALSLALVLSLSGCSMYSLEKLRVAVPRGDAFQEALAAGYARLAETEEKEYDWLDSWHFADKGLLAAYGRETAPEAVSDWNLPPESVAELTEARESLTEALASTFRARQPLAAANAQIAFDCWVEQQEENWQADEIARCRNAYYSAMRGLTGRLPDYVETDPPLVVADSRLAYYEWNEAVSADAEALAARIAAEMKNSSRYELLIHGHADTSGGEFYNMELSRARADGFRNLLIRHGVPEERIRLFAFGESDPRLPTGDGVREPVNRRVEIFLNNREKTP